MAKSKASLKAIAECKSLRANRKCGHGCADFHTHARKGYPQFCKPAMWAERERG